MSGTNVELVRRLIEANRSGSPEETIEKVIAQTAPDVEFQSRLTQVDGARYRGHDGMRRYHADLTDTMSEWCNEIESIEEIEPGRVLAQLTFRGVGRSGINVELGSVLLVLLSAAGLVTGVYAFATRPEALEAARSAD